MHVSMASTFGVKCGIATYTKYLCEALAKQEVYTEVLAEKPYPAVSFDKDWSSPIPYRSDWIRTEPYLNLIRDSENFDILHIQHQFGLFPNVVTLAQLMNKAKKPIVITLHDVASPHAMFKNYYENLLKADRIIVHTKTCFDLVKAWDADMSKVSLIPHGTLLVSIPDKLQSREGLGFPRDAEILLSWGFINQSKGILELVLALSEILKTHPKTILVHAGGIHPIITGTSYLNKILETAASNNISPKQFQVTQWVAEADVPKWFAIADVIVLNHARNIACASGSAHRAMAMHRPIVKTTDSCLEDIPGYQVPHSSPSDFSKGILTVLEDESLQKDLVGATDRASQEMSWENIAKQHKDLYQKVLT